jgi:nucleoside phosphorylase/CheY-like chemotaxis protein
MRILIVEDYPEKLTRILNAVRAVPDFIPERLDYSTNSTEAKRLLRNNFYDLVILDISLPERAEELPTHDGGIRLLEEILDRDIYIRPREIVGLTAYAEVLDSAGQRFGEDLWHVIYYDNTSEFWAEQLQRKIRHISLALRSDPIAQYASHMCVVCALATPELTAVLNLDWKWQRFEVPSDPTIYYRGSISRGGEPREIIAASGSRMGMTSAAVLSMKMIHRFRPRYLGMTGITAGVKGRSSYGDVIVADPCWDWGSGKYQVQEGVHQFAAAPYQLSLNSFLRSKFVLLSNDAVALDSIRRDWIHSTGINVAPRLFIGPVASGAAVLADSALTKTVLGQHRKLMGIEMETYGLFAAAEESPLPQPKAFAIKGVSDFADSDKTDSFQEYAAYTSAQCLRIFAEQYL